MKLVFRFLLLFVFIKSSACLSNIWEAGELTYKNGSTEISAFVNTKENTQLQVVLCSKKSIDNYRFTLLLPQKVLSDSVIKVKVYTDDSEVEQYAEVSGNSIDFQVDESLLLAIPYSAKLQLEFNSEDAEYLGLPKILDVSMKGAELALKNVSSQCTALCLNNGFSCNKSLLSSILWPVNSFNSLEYEQIDDLCTKQTRPDVYRFNLTKKCKAKLDRFYNNEGVGPLSFVYQLFNSPNSAYKKYEQSWKETVALSPVVAEDMNRYELNDWYLLLYSLVGNRHIREFPNSFYSINNHKGDPTTLVYDIDNRYEMELLKYSSVLYRRMNSSIKSKNSVTKTLKLWSDFYRQLTQMLPNIHHAQAVRPIIYKSMLMRIWNLAGRPNGVKFYSKNMFRHGTNGKTITDEILEKQCSLFEGSNGEQFFYASSDCVKSVADIMRTSPYNTSLYRELEIKWDNYAKAWMSSPFYNDSLDDAIGENKRANLTLIILSLFREYGFGDYFQIRECLSSRDSDICSYESNKYYSTYTKEFNYRLDSISNVSADDANSLNELNNLYLEYYHALELYLDDLVSSNTIPLWRADFIKSLASIVQTNAMLNFAYSREELPDISQNMQKEGTDEKMTIEQDKYDDNDGQPDDIYNSDDDIDEDIIVPM